jgi:hypothetical protein
VNSGNLNIHNSVVTINGSLSLTSKIFVSSNSTLVFARLVSIFSPDLINGYGTLNFSNTIYMQIPTLNSILNYNIVNFLAGSTLVITNNIINDFKNYGTINFLEESMIQSNDYIINYGELNLFTNKTSGSYGIFNYGNANIYVMDVKYFLSFNNGNLNIYTNCTLSSYTSSAIGKININSPFYLDINSFTTFANQYINGDGLLILRSVSITPGVTLLSIKTNLNVYSNINFVNAMASFERVFIFFKSWMLTFI